MPFCLTFGRASISNQECARDIHTHKWKQHVLRKCVPCSCVPWSYVPPSERIHNKQDWSWSGGDLATANPIPLTSTRWIFSSVHSMMAKHAHSCGGKPGPLWRHIEKQLHLTLQNWRWLAAPEPFTEDLHVAFSGPNDCWKADGIPPLQPCALGKQAPAGSCKRFKRQLR